MDKLKTPWRAEFDETGGYDAMTGAWDIWCGAELVCTIDQRNYGQDACDYSYRSPEAEAVAKHIVLCHQMGDEIDYLNSVITRVSLQRDNAIKLTRQALATADMLLTQKEQHHD